jgi:hypothetical protein
VLDPEAALPDVLPELAPPLASFFVASLDIEPEPDADPDADGEDGVDGEVLEPADEDAEPDGEAVEPDGEVVVLREDVLSARSHAVTSAVPKATATASARVLNLMKASVVRGNRKRQQGSGLPGRQSVPYLPPVWGC